MEHSVNNCVRQRVFSNHQIRTIHEEEEDKKEESSWLIYFEDIDHEYEMVEEVSHYYDNHSSMISDAASPVHNTKINNVARRKANSINTNPKKRRIIHQDKEDQQQEEGHEEEEEEDTASSPSNKTKGFHVLDGEENNSKHGQSIDNITSEVIYKKHCVTRDTRSKINEEFFSAELKKRGLCVVPLSMLSNFIA